MRLAVLAPFTLAVPLATAPAVQAQEAPSSIAPTGHETKEVDAPKLPATGPMLPVSTPIRRPAAAWGRAPPVTVKRNGE